MSFIMVVYGGERLLGKKKKKSEITFPVRANESQKAQKLHARVCVCVPANVYVRCV